MNYYDKYLKYKNKYLELKYYLNQKGGDKAIIRNIDKINLFIDDEMEKYLNPIYGMILCYNGYITNNYFLAKSKLIDTPDSKLIDTPDSKIIKKYTNFIPHTVQPSKEYMEYTPLDIGRFIGLKYYKRINSNFFEITKKKKIIFKLITSKEHKEHIELLQKYIALFGRDIQMNENLFTFHFILYCLWWVSNNDEGISEYYKGINEVFSIINKYLPEDKKITLINTSSDPTPNPDSFENLIFQITSEPFKIYNQEQSDTFCDLTKKIKYPDCGETTVRNLINLICFKDNRFDISILKELGAIPELEEYYRHFNNFETQSSINTTQIYDLELNARDAWSKLIIEYDKNNINFLYNCNDNKINYELNAKLTKDGSNTNFFQLIQTGVRITL